MNTWRCTGSEAAMSGALDSEELSTGTSRQPIRALAFRVGRLDNTRLDMGR